MATGRGKSSTTKLGYREAIDIAQRVKARLSGDASRVRWSSLWKTLNLWDVVYDLQRHTAGKGVRTCLRDLDAREEWDPEGVGLVREKLRLLQETGQVERDHYFTLALGWRRYVSLQGHHLKGATRKVKTAATRPTSESPICSRPTAPRSLSRPSGMLYARTPPTQTWP